MAFFTFVLLAVSSAAQNSFSLDEPFAWPNAKAPKIPAIEEKYKSADAIILEDKTQLYFYASNNEKIKRNLLIKINSKNGAVKFSALQLPESFDQGHDEGLYKLGRRSRIKAPYTHQYIVTKFAARKFSRNRWQPLNLEQSFEKIRWIKPDGEFANDQLTVFQLAGVTEGDIVELFYEAEFNAAYGSNLFYMTAGFPKLYCEFDFIYKVEKRFSDYAFILPMNIKDSAIIKSVTRYPNYDIYDHKITLRNLAANNYPCNSFESKTMPHVFADFVFYRKMTNSFPSGSERIYEYDLFRPKNFEWIIFKDTANDYMKIYDKQFTSLRKFISTLPSTDSTNMPFFKALCDTFNNFRFITSNQLYYNESALYDIYSADHLLKHRLVEHTMWKVYRDILNDKKIFYYVVNVQDRRFGEHTMLHRAHYAYEANLLAVPSGSSYIYFMPRYGGVKYHLNELPFYFEGSLAAMSGKNFQADTKDKEARSFKLIRTHKGTFTENTRTENSTVKVNLDSLYSRLTTKESLSGQFSTILRHLYLNEYIDSTVSPNYYKKCTEKPLSGNHKIKLSSHIEDFPFRYTFNCSENVKLTNAKKFDLTNWFSFPISKSQFPLPLFYDYYFDFDFTDSYNFMLDFGKPVQIVNSAQADKKIDNDYFSLESGIVKNSPSTYLLKVTLVIKQQQIPAEKSALLLDLAQQLDELNSLSLELAY